MYTFPQTLTHKYLCSLQPSSSPFFCTILAQIFSSLSFLSLFFFTLSSMEGANHSTTTNTKNQKLAAEKNNHKEKDTSKFYYHFLFKAALVAIFFIILPLFPSQAPEFISKSLVTRIWELLHILFFGIAISYGLFSRRNDEGDKENAPKFDNAQNLVTRFLQVSSFFEDEEETPSEFSDGTKVQTWNNQHYRNEPVVVEAPQAQKTNLESRVSSVNGEKPLLLPVRSLKSRLSDGDDVVQPFNMSNSSKIATKRLFSSNSMKARNEEHESPGSVSDSKMKENNVVLPSPIPWRSRSGKFELKHDQAESPVSTTQYGSIYNNKPSMEESEFNKVESRSIKPQSSRSSRTSPSPKELSPSPSPNSISLESLAKSAEDVVVRKKGFYKSCPPPPPPPPPVFQKSISMKPKYGYNNNNSIDKELKRSFTSQGKLEHDEEDFMEEPIRKSNIGKGYENISSFRTDKFVSEPSPMEFVKKESFLDKVIVETDDDDEEVTETEDEDHHVIGRNMMQKQTEETITPKVDEEGSRTNEPSSDVDKKADEFIAKFREQIRLQRIESIKRSTRSTRNTSG